MGSQATIGMIDATDDLGLSRRVALEWHLKYNHFPPLPDGAVDMAERVIELADKGEWDATVRPADYLPNGRMDVVKVWRVVEAWHLEEFITDDGW